MIATTGAGFRLSGDTLERTGEAANMLFEQGKFGFPASTGIPGKINTERCLRINMNKAEIRELIPAAPVYPGVLRLFWHSGEQL